MGREGWRSLIGKGARVQSFFFSSSSFVSFYSVYWVCGEGRFKRTAALVELALSAFGMRRCLCSWAHCCCRHLDCWNLCLRGCQLRLFLLCKVVETQGISTLFHVLLPGNFGFPPVVHTFFRRLLVLAKSECFHDFVLLRKGITFFFLSLSLFLFL